MSWCGVCRTSTDLIIEPITINEQNLVIFQSIEEKNTHIEMLYGQVVNHGLRRDHRFFRQTFHTCRAKKIWQLSKVERSASEQHERKLRHFFALEQRFFSPLFSE